MAVVGLPLCPVAPLTLVAPDVLVVPAVGMN
jgi:hypothetical protein